MTANMNFSYNVHIRQVSLSDPSAGPRDWYIHNLVPTTGLDRVRDLFYAQSSHTAKLILLGGGTTAPYSTDTALQDSTYTLTISTDTTMFSGGVRFIGYLETTMGAGSTFAEIGLFTSSSGMFARALIEPQIVKTTSSPTLETIYYTVEFTPTETT